jgi:hypothetical protein
MRESLRYLARTGCPECRGRDDVNVGCEVGCEVGCAKNGGLSVVFEEVGDDKPMDWEGGEANGGGWRKGVKPDDSEGVEGPEGGWCEWCPLAVKNGGDRLVYWE